MSSAATVYQTLNLIAIICAALAGSTAARRRGLDPVGILYCAFITGLGGGLLRDVLLQDGFPPASPIPGTPLVARWRHWVLPPAARPRAGTPSGPTAASTEPTRPAPNLNTPTQLQER